MAKKKRSKTDYDVIYSDRDIIVTDKPAGLLSVPIRGMQTVNLQEMLQFDLGSDDIRPAHRIDRYTTGIVIFAGNRPAWRHLVKQFRNHEPERVYLALIRGTPKKTEGTLVHYMKRIKKGFRNVVVPGPDKGGTKAVLHYRVVKTYGDISLVAIRLETGLKNQIRVQFETIGHPMVGDRHYSPKEINEPAIDRQALHAAELTIVHPDNGQSMTFKSPLPKDMNKVIEYYKTRK